MTNVQSVLQDLVSYAIPLNFNTIRVTGTDTSTLFEAVREDRRVIMKATVSEQF